jgi:hypothetical protein
MFPILVLVACIGLAAAAVIFILVIAAMAVAKRIRRWRKGSYTTQIARSKGITFTS